jgi:hypothetical protein
MCRQIVSVGVRWMAHLINHTQMTPDHMTLRPISWWEKQFARHGYRLRHDLKAPVVANSRMYGLNGDPEHVYTFWERIR